MYFFYFDESGSRDPDVGNAESPKDHIYVLLAVGMYERQWRPFEREVSGLKLELADRLQGDGVGTFDLADCEVKSNWLRNPNGREKASPFLSALVPEQRQRLTDVYLAQVEKRNSVIMASVIDKRYLDSGTTLEMLHQRAYELLLGRVQNYITTYHPRHQALIVMDDTDKNLNRTVAMQHASLLRDGKWLLSIESFREFHFPASSDIPGGIQLTMNPTFQNIVEYPFFTRSELSNGIQLADQLAYNVYRAFRDCDFTYQYFENILSYFYRSRDGVALHGLAVWPDSPPLVNMAQIMWDEYKRKPPCKGGPQ